VRSDRWGGQDNAEEAVAAQPGFRPGLAGVSRLGASCHWAEKGWKGRRSSVNTGVLCPEQEWAEMVLQIQIMLHQCAKLAAALH